MKTNFLKSILSLAFIAISAISCVDDQYTTPSFDCVGETLQVTKQVSQIPASSIVTQYTQDDIIEAYVVSSDKEGNFYKSVSFQTLDGSKAFSVPMDIEATFASFEVGSKIFIKMLGLYTDISYDGMRIGGLFVNSSGEAGVGRLTRAQVRASLFNSCQIKSETELVQSISLLDVTKPENINKLIEIDGVQFDDDAVSDTYYNETKDVGGATNHMIMDKFNNKLVFRTSSFAGFANKTVPMGSGKIRGILTKFDDTYQFVARYENDVKLSQPRFTPVILLFQDFESINNTGNGAFISLPGWSNRSMNSTQANPERWEARIFQNNKYAQMSLFGTSDTNGDVRLITPAVNLNNTLSELLKFEIKTAFWEGLALTVWYSTDYDGSGSVAAINAATWSELTTTLPTIDDDVYADDFYRLFVNTSSISGTNVHFSFRYRGGTNSGITTLYQVDNIQVIGGN
jgi:hypothetical protein